MTVHEFKDSKLSKRLKWAKHGTFLAVGTGQWGKTVTMNALAAEAPFRGRNVVLINYSKDFVKKGYPSNYRAEKWPGKIADLYKIIKPGEDFIILDDAIFMASSRDTQTKENKEIQKFMTILSHNDLFAGISIQNTSLLDFSMMQSQDVHVLHKFMDPVALQFERPSMKLKQTVANAMLVHYWKRYPDVNAKSWTWCSSKPEMVQFHIPWWWQSTMSKAFRGVIPK